MIRAAPFWEMTTAPFEVVMPCQDVTPLYRTLAPMVSVTDWPSGRARVIDVAETALTWPRSKVKVCQVAVVAPGLVALISTVPWSARFRSLATRAAALPRPAPEALVPEEPGAAGLVGPAMTAARVPVAAAPLVVAPLPAAA